MCPERACGWTRPWVRGWKGWFVFLVFYDGDRQMLGWGLSH